MSRCARLLICSLVAGCSIGTPPGFAPAGQSYSVPLVGPLENGLLVVPVRVNGHGPYLFEIDPDAGVSAVDRHVVYDAQLWTGQGPRRFDETYTSHPAFYAELLGIQIGNLTIERGSAMVFPVGAYDAEDRHISGVLGRDVLADSLVFGFDRDQGVATLSTVAAFHPPADAVAVDYELTGGVTNAPVERPLWQGSVRGFRGVVPWIQRRVASAEIDGHTFSMHLDLGAATSQLAASKWQTAGLAPASVKLRLTDEAGSVRQVARAGIAPSVTLGAAAAGDVTFAPYIDARFPLQRIDGALGLDFFRRYSVFVSWDHRTFYLRPRTDTPATTAARLARWGAAVPSCPHPGCVTAEVATTDAGPVLHVVRDPEAAGHALEVGLSTGRDGAESAVPLVVEFPAAVSQLTRPVSPAYEGAALAVIDVSPFPRACPNAGGCVWQRGRPLPAVDAAPAPIVGSIDSPAR